MKIEDIIAREIFDSRGIPTIECDIHLDDNMVRLASYILFQVSTL